MVSVNRIVAPHLTVDVQVQILNPIIYIYNMLSTFHAAISLYQVDHENFFLYLNHIHVYYILQLFQFRSVNNIGKICLLNQTGLI